jgi:CHC2 zinc finger/Toprim-like
MPFARAINADQLLPLREIISTFIGPPDSRAGANDEWWLCPFHADGNPSLHVMPDGRRWKCFGCDAAGDRIDFLRGLYPDLTYPNASFLLSRHRSAAALLDALGSPTCSTCSTCPPKRGGVALNKLPALPDAEWQAEARSIIRTAQRLLPASDGAAYIESRGLNAQSAKGARLGYLPDGHQAGNLCGPAILMPWFVGKRLVAVNARNLSPDRERYKLLTGSKRSTLYPSSRIDPTRPVMVCEGEFDCLFANQEAGDLVQAVTLGSASGSLTAETLIVLACVSFTFLAFDADDAGDKAASRLAVKLPNAVRLRPPARAKDLSGLGPSLRSWIESALRRHVRGKHRRPIGD